MTNKHTSASFHILNIHSQDLALMIVLEVILKAQGLFFGRKEDISQMPHFFINIHCRLTVLRVNKSPFRGFSI
uniref:Uncharacterized protein n=1 Tax=Glossina palpalis gambiensis TaxID=67801 RepID=A0A1B0AQ36_9MUSC